ncbi:MAG: alpha/beta hydrolase-fold protein [Polyangiaceae bacterium]
MALAACRDHGGKPAEPTATAVATPATSGALPTTSASARTAAAAPHASASVGVASPAPVAPTPARELTWRWDHTPVGPMVVVVSIPETDRKLPVLIAMHGLGESEKGPVRGARGWLDDYRLDEALERLASPPIQSADYQRLGGSARREELNAVLAAHPYEGMILVMPYTPNILEPDRSLDGADALGEFLVEEVLPKVHRQTPALSDAESTGIDGVSLGGRAALLVGLSHPERFGVVGTLQAAVYPHEIDDVVTRVKSARTHNPKQQLRLLTSSGDFYRGTLAKLSRALTRQKLVHHFIVVEGPHAYAFNRGPGVYEMLVFHDRALRNPLPIGP